MSLGIATVVQAQPTPQLLPQVSIGIKGGANLTALPTQDRFDAEGRAGYLVGIWSRVGVVGWFVQPELYFSSKNAKFTDTGTGAENTFRVNGLDLPILVGRRFGDNGIYGRINTGPVLSFATRNKQAELNKYDLALLKIKSQGLQWQFGGGIDISRLSIDLRYEQGLNKIKNANESSTTRFNNFNISLAYRIFST